MLIAAFFLICIVSVLCLIFGCQDVVLFLDLLDLVVFSIGAELNFDS